MTEPLTASFVLWHWLAFALLMLGLRWAMERLCRWAEGRRGY